MSNFLEKLQLSKVDWETSKDSPYIFEAVSEGKMVRLRLNDFPDEPLCTVIVDGAEANLDDFPKTWTLPRHRTKLS